MIVIKNLKKAFGKHVVIDGINFHLKKGECVVVVGPSGSGKSTFIRLINRLEEPTKGEIYYMNQLITHKNINYVRQNVGMVFQHFNLINNLTVLENLTLSPNVLHTMPRHEIEKKAMKYLHRIGLADKRDQYPSSLSGGQKQRVAIVRALMLNPEVLLFDEPTSALDPEMINEVLELIREVVADGMTTIIVTHELNFAKEIASRIVFIDKGKIIEEGNPKDFFEHPSSRRVKTFLSKILK